MKVTGTQIAYIDSLAHSEHKTLTGAAKLLQGCGGDDTSHRSSRVFNLQRFLETVKVEWEKNIPTGKFETYPVKTHIAPKEIELIN